MAHKKNVGLGETCQERIVSFVLSLILRLLFLFSISHVPAYN